MQHCPANVINNICKQLCYVDLMSFLYAIPSFHKYVKRKYLNAQTVLKKGLENEGYDYEYIMGVVKSTKTKFPGCQIFIHGNLILKIMLGLPVDNFPNDIDRCLNLDHFGPHITSNAYTAAFFDSYLTDVDLDHMYHTIHSYRISEKTDKNTFKVLMDACGYHSLDRIFFFENKLYIENINALFCRKLDISSEKYIQWQYENLVKDNPGKSHNTNQVLKILAMCSKGDFENIKQMGFTINIDERIKK